MDKVMSIEELLRKRFKVIADFPGNNFSIGDVLIKDGDWYWKVGSTGWEERFTKGNVEQYPHLFKPLAWYEEREASELPEYIRFYEPLPEKYSIWKINEWRFGLKNPLVKTDRDIVWREISTLDQPATETDYITYLNSQTK